MHSVAKGTVKWAGWDWTGYGLKVEIQHESGYRSLYGHLSRIYVKPGAQVGADSYIGEVGTTGRSTGCHLHLEIAEDGWRLNPLAVLPM